MENNFSLKDSIRFILKNWKILVIVFFVSAIVIALLSLMLPNYYKAQVTFLPAENYAISKSVLSQMENYSALDYGDEENSEYLMEILNSNTLIIRTIAKFNLAQHYGIDISKGKTSLDKMNRKLVSNIKVKRTENLGVKLTVWDIDPKYSADIANYMAHESQKIRTEMKKNKMDSIYKYISLSRERMLEKINVLTDSLSKKAERAKMLSAVDMSARLSQELAKQIGAGNSAAVKRLEDRLAQTGKDGAALMATFSLLDRKMESIKIWDYKIEQVRMYLEAYIPKDFIVDAAYPNLIKDKPKRSMIALLGAVGCTLLAVFVLAIFKKKE
jgi:uncharacterized protein involved in exopolysaccharide biosynthesis